MRQAGVTCLAGSPSLGGQSLGQRSRVLDVNLRAAESAAGVRIAVKGAVTSAPDGLTGLVGGRH